MVFPAAKKSPFKPLFKAQYAPTMTAGQFGSWVRGSSPLVTALVAAGVLVPPSVQRHPSAPVVLERVQSYLTDYKSALATVIAKEDSRQRITRQWPAEPRMPRDRRLTSEVHFKFVGGGQSWMAIREVLAVDGVPTASQSGLVKALQTQEPGLVAQDFKTRNAQFNIGRTARNLNEPTLALGIFEAGRIDSFQFSVKKTRVDNAVDILTLAFVEQASPSPFVLDFRMTPARVQGEVDVETASGRVRRTVLKVDTGAVVAELTTAFAHDAKLDLWVPTHFREHYESGADLGARVNVTQRVAHEEISCEATYTNYRRFVTTARIK